MKVGTKSLLIGAHQFLWHPFTVMLAWGELHGKWPDWKVAVCIFIHDLGYWGCSDMEGEDGKWHPRFAAILADKWFDGGQGWIFENNYSGFCAFHSRSYAEFCHAKPSPLCWADKLAVKFDPWWFYLLRVYLSGEIYEYRKAAADAGLFPLSGSDKDWYFWAQERMIRKAYAQDIRPPYEAKS